jgi:deoxyribonuclease-4
MENSAGPGATVGRSLEELQTLMDRLDKHPRLGICLDSCHLYASGYDVTDPEQVDAVITQIDNAMGIDRVRALHVNDSAMPLGSNRDRHANIGEGLMGEGLGAFIAHPALQHLSAYLEVPGVNKEGPNADEIQKLRDLHARWTNGV